MFVAKTCFFKWQPFETTFSINQLVCCPDNAVQAPAITPAVNIALEPSDSASVPPLNDFFQIKNHRNINLVNDKSCGSSTTVDRIIGGTKASPGEFPWM